MEYVSLPTVCCSECVSEWNSCVKGSEIKTEKLWCVLGTVSGTV